MKKVPYKKGFTLIELVLVTAILAVISLAVYGTFSNGLNIWKTVTEDSAAENVSLFFEKITSDLRNSFKLSSIKFRGSRNKVSFPSRIRYEGDDGIVNSIGQVTYNYDRRSQSVIRRVANYSEVYQKKPGEKRILVESVSKLEFRYYVQDTKTDQYSWVSSWQERDDDFGLVVEDALPLIVEIKLIIKDGKKNQEFTKTFPIPSGCCWPVIKE